MLFKQIFMYYLGGFKLHREAYKRNIRMGRQNYGQIFCTQCGERIGHVISKDYKYLYLVSICKCGCEVVYQTKYENPDNTQNYFILIKEKSLIVAFMLYVIAASNIIFLFPKSVI